MGLEGLRASRTEHNLGTRPVAKGEVSSLGRRRRTLRHSQAADCAPEAPTCLLQLAACRCQFERGCPLVLSLSGKLGSRRNNFSLSLLLLPTQKRAAHSRDSLSAPMFHILYAPAGLRLTGSGLCSNGSGLRGTPRCCSCHHRQAGVGKAMLLNDWRNGGTTGVRQAAEAPSAGGFL